MGRYMRTRRKSNTEVSLMEPPSLNGVLTRAKTLALQNAAVSSYIQLRSRRLVKPNLVKKEKGRVVNSLVLEGSFVKEKDICKESDEQGSIGENLVEIEARGRTTRETTPCSLIGDPDTIKIPGSSTKATIPFETEYRVQDTTPRQILSTSEMEEFFTGPEKQQQQLFIEKYNFDPVNDKPLPGRYEWVKLDATKKS